MEISQLEQKLLYGNHVSTDGRWQQRQNHNIPGKKFVSLLEDYKNIILLLIPYDHSGQVWFNLDQWIPMKNVNDNERFFLIIIFSLFMS